MVSTGEGIRETAEMVKRFLEEIGAEVELVPLANGKGSPVVCGQLHSVAARKTLLIYGMYDVVSVDHPEEWSSPPWEANIVDGKIIGRGAVNTKGPLMAFIEAVRSVRSSGLDLPVSLIFAIEGEEEPGSPNLPEFIEKYSDRLRKADALFMPLTSQFWGEEVEVWLGTNGILYVDLELRDKKQDIGGLYSPIVENPAWRILDALSSMRDLHGRVAIEGWYDDMQSPTEEEMKLIENLAGLIDEKEMKKAIGVERFKRDLSGLELWKTLYFEPRFNLMGIVAGYYGPGTKSTTPAWCRAKVAFSLLPNADVNEKLEKLKKHLNDHGFGDLEVKPQITIDQWTRFSMKDEIIRAVIGSYRDLGREPLIHPYQIGGSPLYLFNRSPYLKLPCGMGGFGYTYLHHRVDEFMTVAQYLDNIRLYATILYRYAEASRTPDQEA